MARTAVISALLLSLTCGRFPSYKRVVPEPTTSEPLTPTDTILESDEYIHFEPVQFLNSERDPHGVFEPDTLVRMLLDSDRTMEPQNHSSRKPLGRISRKGEKNQTVWNPFAAAPRSPLRQDRVRQVTFDQQEDTPRLPEGRLLVPVTEFVISSEEPVLDPTVPPLYIDADVLVLRTESGGLVNIFLDPHAVRLTKDHVIDILRHVPNIAPVVSMGTMKAGKATEGLLVQGDQFDFITVMSDCEKIISNKDALSSNVKSNIQSVVLGLHAASFTVGAHNRADLVSMFCQTRFGGAELINWGTIRPFASPRKEVMHDLKISFDL